MNQRTATPITQVEKIGRSLAWFHERGEVIEIRALNVCGRRRTDSGYYDDPHKAAEAIAFLDSIKPTGIYHTLSPCNPALLSRACNRTQEWAQHTTADDSILHRRWLMVDIDPARAAGIAATSAEQAAASTAAIAIEDQLRARGWSYPILQDSGNGFYLLFRIDLPNNEKSTKLIKAVLAGIGSMVDDARVHVDQSVFNAARIARVPFTMNRKGDNLPDRPHRVSTMRPPEDECPVETITLEQLQEIALLAPDARSRSTTSSGPRPGASTNGQHSRLDVPRYLQARNIGFRPKATDGGTLYIVPCPFDGSHGGNGEAAIAQRDDGMTTFECKHNSCQGRQWADYKHAVGAPDRDHYDPPLSPSSTTSSTASSGAGPAAGPVTYRPASTGTLVKAADRGNIGTVVEDHGSACRVRFVSQDGQSATISLSKEKLTLQNGTPLARTIGQWRKAPTIGELVRGYPKLRKPVIRGLLRIGETMGIVAPPKRGKSWLATQMAIQKATGLDFLGKFATEPGKVLILDNELHEETSADRVPKVCDALGIPFESVQNRLYVENLRGMGLDINSLGDYLEQYEPGELDLILLDAIYRFLPPGVDENSNSQMTGVFNRIDQYAKRLNCGFGAVHHASKGNQAAKGVTDVGSGAGAQSRAVDCHLVLRDHAEADHVVLEAAARSWAPVEPIVLRWEFPSWTVADDQDPTRLRTEKPTAASRLETVKDEVQKALVHFPDGASKRGIQSYTGRPSCWERALRELVDNGQVTECQIKNPTNGKLDTGYKRVYDDGEF